MRSRVLHEIVALLAPPSCVACREPLPRPEDALCAGCRRALPWLRGPRCPRCALPRPCAPCPAAKAAFVRAWAPLAHEGPARALVNALKFGGALALADLMAAQIAAGAPAGWLDGGARLVPVPAHPVRRRGRGFDQAERLAAGLARRSGAAVVPCLARSGPARRQLGAGRRVRSVPGRIVLRVTERVPERALLIDDVHTTGATLDACSRALRGAGAREIRALTYTRTLKR